MNDYQQLVEKVLEFEKKNEDVLLAEKIEDKLIYPIIRWNLLSSIIYSYSKFEKPYSSLTNQKLWKLNFAQSLVMGWTVHSYRIRKMKSDFLIFSISGLRRRKVNNLYFDTIYDNLASLFPNEPVILEEGTSGVHYSPAFSKKIIYLEPLNLQAKIAMLQIPRSKKKIVKTFVDELEQRIIQEFPQVIINKTILSKQIIYGLEYSRIVMRLVNKIRPKLVFVHCGSYGGKNSIIIKECKNLGIKVAEFQHGWVGNSHLAYNYAINNEIYKNYLPDYFLTFGQYWNDSLKRYPSQKVVIGNPDLARRWIKYKNKNITTNPTRKKILVVSQGIVSSLMVTLAKKLRNLLPEKYEIIFKLHPGEIAFEDRYRSLYNISGITVVKDGSIYDYIANSIAIVGFNSTTLFEALPFEKSIFIYDDIRSRAYIPEGIGKWFKSAEELAELIVSKDKPKNKVDWKYYWKMDWQESFRSFITMLSGRQPERF
ncbi:hypothetical protein [Kosmotoga olearia]|uniref:CDP-glycerol:poly(Glycerophosphate) glycerophosphotransferase n=1 Tax=Kosmotoga olearia (strain ATCC BAA-1733 / DSM 21960 / TBF 19.5.1) TaxID=521045 RepID=C5CDB7_KOSOT|nr:hypothetical protein [Kosmotoga olearia]ACR79980.1 hypothetical protein Kole_1286 [Kosmotoga olearia TBF 19.5.1]